MKECCKKSCIFLDFLVAKHNRDIATEYTPDSWLKNHEITVEWHLCIAYLGAWNEENNIKDYMKESEHVLGLDSTLLQWTRLRKNLEGKIESLGRKETVIDVMYDNGYVLRDGYWYPTPKWIPKSRMVEQKDFPF